MWGRVLKRSKIQMSADETRQMPAVEAGQMIDAEAGQMSAVETRQMPSPKRVKTDVY